MAKLNRRPTPNPIFEKEKEDFLRRAEGFIGLKDDLEEEIDHIGNPRTAINNLYKQAQQLVKYIEDHYHNELYNPRKWYPRKWMIDDPIISRLLKKYRIADVLNTVERCARSMKDKNGFVCKDNKKREGVIFVADANFYKTVLPELGMKQITLQKYLLALCKINALLKVDHVDRNASVYALGYYTGAKYYNLPMFVRFVTQKDKEMFRKFVL